MSSPPFSAGQRRFLKVHYMIFLKTPKVLFIDLSLLQLHSIGLARSLSYPIALRSPVESKHHDPSMRLTRRTSKQG